MKNIFFFFLFLFSGSLFGQLTLKITSLPVNTPQDAEIFVAGNFQNWQPGQADWKLTENANGIFEITFTPPVGTVEYKFTRGEWTSVEGNALGGQLPNRTFQYTGAAATVEIQIATWEDLSGGGNGSTAAPNVHILSNSFFMSQLNRSRRIWIYLPPDYETSEKYYPVLYMHDGQNVFDEATSFSGEWSVDESLNGLHGQGDYGCIVVAVDNGGALRIDELAPWLNENYNEGGEGSLYLDFFVETLKPYVDEHYRTLTGRDYTGIMGSSLGGLISQYGVMEHQEVFSKAGIFSPAFWFNDPEIYQHSANTPKTEALKIYSLAGYPEDGGSVVAAVNQMESVLLNNDFESTELNKQFHQDGQHSEWYWAREFPAAYEWLFGDLNLSAASEEAAQRLRIFPNPADTVLQLDNLPDAPRLHYRILAADGRALAAGRLPGNTVDVSRLPAGACFLQVFSKKKLIASEAFYMK